MKYIIYLGVAALTLWAAAYLVRNIRRQLKGGCACGGGQCSGDCGLCALECKRDGVDGKHPA